MGPNFFNKPQPCMAAHTSSRWIAFYGNYKVDIQIQMRGEEEKRREERDEKEKMTS